MGASKPIEAKVDTRPKFDATKALKKAVKKATTKSKKGLKIVTKAVKKAKKAVVKTTLGNSTKLGNKTKVLVVKGKKATDLVKKFGKAGAKTVTLGKSDKDVLTKVLSKGKTTVIKKTDVSTAASDEAKLALKMKKEAEARTRAKEVRR